MQKKFNLVWQNVSSHKEEEKTKSLGATTDTTLIKNVIKRSSEIRDQVIIIKLPSTIIDNDELLTNFVENIHLISICGAKIFIVHDHTNLVKETLTLFGIEEKFISGIKVSDHRSAQIVEMVVSGYINKLIVSKLCSFGCQAIGISGKDSNLIQAKKSRLLHKSSANPEVIDIGFISEPILINPEILLNFEENNIIPVISPIASDGNGCTHLLDVNLVASIISSTLDADHLVFPCEEQLLGTGNFKTTDIRLLQQILHASNQSSAVISLIEAATGAVENSDNCVHLVNAKARDSILLSIFTDI